MTRIADVSARGIALVTGASSGIGAVYADRLARRGHDLILVARDRARLEGLAQRIRATFGVQVETLPADLTDPADLRHIEQRLRNDPRIDTLVNNAGIALNGDLAAAKAEDLDALIDLNIRALTRLAAAAAANFAAQQRGTLINISSVLALAPELFNATYSASKAYVLSFTQALEKELNPKGVRLQAVLPGVTRTEIWSRSGNDAQNPPAEMVMEVDDMVDAALAGLDQNERVTIPSLPEQADWEAYDAARRKLLPNLSRNRAAARYRPS